MKSKKILHEIYRELRIPERIIIYKPTTYQRKGRTYYRFPAYDPKTRRKNLKIHIPVKKQDYILKLWQEYEEARKSEEVIKKDIEAILEKYEDTQTVIALIEEVMKEALKKETKTYAYEKFKQKALELFEGLKPYLVYLKKKKLSRISLMEALYILANVKEMFKEKGDEELKKALKRAVETVILRDKNQKIQSPLGVLKNDFFLPQKTEYDFLLSSFLKSELEPAFEKLLQSEVEKLEAQEALAKISGFLATLSERAKERVLKVFPSFEEFSKALYEGWKKSGEELREFLKEWQYYLELDVLEEDEENVLKIIGRLKVGAVL
ncbi:hypothetical protein JCM9492_00020 [Aquifex pyrophilus]